MLISDLNYLETVSVETAIEGGLAIAFADADGFAFGPSLAVTSTDADTVALDLGVVNIAASESNSTSIAN